MGGGVVGLAVASAIARSGAAAVTLLERRRIGGASSGELTGGVRDLFAAKPLIDLSHLSLGLMAELSDGGSDIGWSLCGYLYLATDASQFDRLPYSDANRGAYRARIERLGPAEIAERYPWIGLDGIVGGAFYAEAGVCTPRLLVEALARRSREAGVELREGAEVARIVLSGGRARGVATADGQVEGDAIVLATAGWTPALLAGLGVSLPIVPKRGQLFLVPHPSGVRASTAFVFDYGIGAYFRPARDGIVLGGGDAAVAPTSEPTLSHEDGPRMVALVSKRLPGIAGAAVKQGWVGVRDVTPDDHGVVGGVPGIEGLYVAAGFGGHGTMHALGIGATLAALVDGRRPPIDARPFSAARFASAPAVAT